MSHSVPAAPKRRLSASFKALTRLIPLKRGAIEQRGSDLYID